MCRLCLGRIGRVIVVVQRVCLMLGRHLGLRLFSNGIHDCNPVKALAAAVFVVCDGIDPAGSPFGAEGSLLDVFRQHLEKVVVCLNIRKARMLIDACRK